MSEKWIPISGFRGRYEVSNMGLIRALFHSVRQHAPPRILKGSPDANGYNRVRLYKRSGESVTKKVYHIVLEEFSGKRKNGQECRHLDGNKTNDRLSNLKWGTHLENMADRTRHGTAVDNSGSKHGMSKLTERDVLEMRHLHLMGRSYGFLAEKYGVAVITAAQAIRRVRWTHVP